MLRQTNNLLSTTVRHPNSTSHLKSTRVSVHITAGPTTTPLGCHEFECETAPLRPPSRISSAAMTCLCLQNIRHTFGPSSKVPLHQFNRTPSTAPHDLASVAVKLVSLFQAPWGYEPIPLADTDGFHLASRYVLVDLLHHKSNSVPAQSNGGDCDLRPC